MKSVTIVGAGFSGLTLAYYLNKLGVPVTVHERAPITGGLIHTHKTTQGLVETAANALIADRHVENLFEELGLTFAKPKRERRKRYIHWRQPRRWPVGLWTTIKIIRFAIFKRMFRPKPGESIFDWGNRAVNLQFVERLLAPGLRGVYAGDPKRMSASLVLARLFGKRQETGQQRGSAAPQDGMGALISKLSESLAQSGVPVKTLSEFRVEAPVTEPTVICSSPWSAAELLKNAYPELSASLQTCESLPLVTATAFFKTRSLKGFGCLFPAGERFHALGVLMNDCIFENRSNICSETWIFGGAGNANVTELNDAQVIAQITTDRRRLTGREEPPVSIKITRWPKALPHYTVEWENTLKSLDVTRPLFLHGNYLGPLGLSAILQRSRELALHLKDLYAI